jgi:hypothetical protein
VFLPRRTCVDSLPLDARNFYEALQLAVSPVILISAYSLLLLSMTNRLGRAIDRARGLARDESPGKEEQIEWRRGS